jgi:hypothetical protein
MPVENETRLETGIMFDNRRSTNKLTQAQRPRGESPVTVTKRRRMFTKCSVGDVVDCDRRFKTTHEKRIKQLSLESVLSSELISTVNHFMLCQLSSWPEEW